ncbi:MAG: barstar family protein [Clostridia bacterium]|nr:barstar family protein [Clostridia bacterium]
MHTIFLDGDKYATPLELHLALKSMLELPEHYGCNADALYDCLSERKEAVHAAVLSPGQGDTAAALRKCLRVIRDLDGRVTEL